MNTIRYLKPIRKGKHYRLAMREAQRNYLTENLRRYGSVSATARAIGMGRNALYSLMYRIGLDWHELPPERRARAIHLREVPHCPTCSCGLVPNASQPSAHPVQGNSHP